jgi:hypothetical protein
MNHTIHIKISEDALQQAIQGVLEHQALDDPTSLTGVVRTCFNVGLAALNPGHHLRRPSEQALQVYHYLSGQKSHTQPDHKTFHQIASTLTDLPVDRSPDSPADPRLANVPEADHLKASRIIAAVDSPNGLSIEQQLNSSNPEVARLARLIWPDVAIGAKARRADLTEKGD